MSEDLAIQLHRLYRDYYARRLDFQDYRYRRGILLDSLAVAVEPEIADATLPRAATAEVATKPAPERPAQAKPGHKFRWYYVLAGCLVIVAGVVFFLGRELEEAVPETKAGRSPSIADAVAVEQPLAVEEEVLRSPTAAQLLVEGFLDQADWRPMSLAEFKDAWTRLPESDRILAKGETWFRPMSEALAYEIEEVREFSRDPDGDEQLDRLYELSLRLGLVELVPPGWMPKPAATVRAAPRDDAPVTEAAPSVAAEAPPGLADPAPASDTAAAETPPPEQPTARSEATDPQAGNDNSCAAAMLQTRRRNCFDLLGNGDKGPVMRVLPAGEASAGAAAGRSIAITVPFAISLFEVTAGEFARFCESTGYACPANPWADADMPVVNVTFEAAVAYGKWLSDQTGRTYRLPTDEEWEYAARAGASTDYPFGDELLPAQARYSSITSYDTPLPTSDRTTQRNEFGLWHVIGNVREWVDATAAGVAAVRGGSYASDDDGLRFSQIEPPPGSGQDATTGFRVLRQLETAR
jgi:hypothetical protein